jgi:hypothetical protein
MYIGMQGDYLAGRGDIWLFQHKDGELEIVAIEEIWIS